MSTRYHPIVFGLSGSVPCLAIYQDRYTLAKLKGAVTHAGLEEWRVPLDAVLTDLPADTFDELWSRRQDITDHLTTVSADWVSMQSRHWDEVWCAVTEPARTLAAEAKSVRSPSSVLESKVAGLAAINIISAERCSLTAARESAWRALVAEADLALRDAKTVRAARAAAVEGLQALLDTSEQDLQTAVDALAVSSAMVAGAQTDLEQVDLRRATVEADNIQMLDEIRQAESSAEAARALVAQLRQHFEAVIGQLATAQSELDTARRQVDEHQVQLVALHATRTMRWTRPARQVYHWIRQHREAAWGRGSGYR